MKERISVQEKLAYVALISFILIFVFYGLFMYHKYMDAGLTMTNDLQFWGKAFLILIPVIIVVEIIIHIIFAIINKIVTNEDVPSISDERDKLIELKATRVAYHTGNVFFILAMVSLAVGMQPWVMFVILVASCLASSCASAISKIYMYRKGI